MKKRYISAILSALMLVPIGMARPADAIVTRQFTVNSDPETAVVDLGRITMPPLPGQPLTIRENLEDQNRKPAGSAAIDCVVVGFTTADLLLDCQARFTLLDGVIHGHVAFLTSQHDYPGVVASGTGAYRGALGAVRVLDRAPGDETYVFTLLALM